MTHNIDGISGRTKIFNMSNNTSINQIQAQDFYSEYHGHLPNHLDKVQIYYNESVANGGHDGIVYFAGDSSLDNKFWFMDQANAENGYENVLRPPKSKKDIAYWCSKISAEGPGEDGLRYGVMNCSIEESTIGDRACGRLMKQDRFIKDNITSRDVLVVSVGGNDIALKPSPCTIVNMLSLIKCSSYECMDNQACGSPLPCDDCCSGFGFSCASTFLGWPLGIGYFVHLFKTRVEAYLNNIVSDNSVDHLNALPRKPKKILVCMIYYPDEVADGSWADNTLSALGYNNDPAKLQLTIRKIFELATEQIRLVNHPEIEIVGVPLFAALDGKVSADYSQRVEPSAAGGEKMARLIMDAVHGRDMHQVYEMHLARDEQHRRERGRSGETVGLTIGRNDAMER